MILKGLSGPDSDKISGYLHYCPGCKTTHLIPVADYPINWDFDGNMEKPTFRPSVRLGEPTDCHYIITGGMIHFCADCTHDLKGTTVPMVHFPPEEE
jgi:hypothetical protein